MKSRLKRLRGLPILWILSVSAGIIFNVSFRAINILSWIGYVGLSIYFIFKIPKRFWLTKEEWFMDDRQKKRKTWGVIIGILLFLLSLLGWILLYKSNIVNTYSQNWANQISKHIRFEQWKTPCISIWEECR